MIAHWKPVFAVQRKRELELFTTETNADLLFCHVYLDGVECKHGAPHNKSVHFGDKESKTKTETSSRHKNWMDKIQR